MRNKNNINWKQNISKLRIPNNRLKVFDDWKIFSEFKFQSAQKNLNKCFYNNSFRVGTNETIINKTESRTY